jgi:glycine/D-amino acid oxidase-like deaminating enzyme
LSNFDFGSPPGLKMNADVVIIGAGVIGTACAYFLARRGADVLVLEKNHPAAGATGASAAMINLGGSSDLPGLAPEFNVESHRLIPDIEPDFDRPLEIIRGGSLYVAMSDREVPEIQNLAEQSRRNGIAGKLLDGPTAREFEPLLGPSIRAAFYNPVNYHLNPFKLCHGFLSAALRRGGQIISGIKVHDVRLRNDRIECVVTDKGNFHTQWVVVAAGAWTPEILSSANYQIPIVPVRGQVILTEACALMTAYTLSLRDHLYVKQTADGNFYLGSQLEFVGFENRITLQKITAYMNIYSQAVPFLSRLRALRFFAGFRPVSADNLPIIGAAPDCSRLIIAAGHGTLGMRYSAITGKMVSELIVDGKTDQPMEAFRVERFAKLAETH